MPFASTEGAVLTVILASGGVLLCLWAITGRSVELFRFGMLKTANETSERRLGFAFGLLLIGLAILLYLL